MTQDEKDELLHALTKYQALKNMSVHATNSAVAHDAQSTLEHIFKILDGLALHTGIYPFWYRTDNVMDFWEDVMDLEPDEIIRKLEQWACMHGESGYRISRSTTQSKACSGCAHEFLILAYVAIKEKHGIDLLGWPDGMPFQSPHAIINAEHLQSLRDALKVGSNAWNIKTNSRSGELLGKWSGKLARSTPM
ncbi:hypothetical protein EDC04DRAFT_2601290 [Pisolithus marmoratus]|nr:hypothetical protein EDC04DRAFT_2601290 [Pisolithus marmoratus]